MYQYQAAEKVVGIKIVDRVSCVNGSFETMVIRISCLGGKSVKVSIK